MAGSYNKIIVIGNLGRDPESRALPSGEMVVNFSVATSERGGHNAPERTTWFRVSAFGKLGETCAQFLHKGSYVYVEGTLSQQEYRDKDGNNRVTLELRAREMRMLDRREDAGESGGYERPVAPRRGSPPPLADDDDLDNVPF